MSKSIVVYLEEKCGGVGNGSREGEMRDKLGPGLGPKDGRGSKKGRIYRARMIPPAKDGEEDLKHI